MFKTKPTLETIKTSTVKLLDYCLAKNWAGYDPYDGLNSKVFRALKFLHFKLPRLALTQLLKNSPVNFRRILLVPKSQSSKGISLFLTSVNRLFEIGLVHDDKIIHALSEKLLGLSSLDDRYLAWGYNFDWQSLGGLVPFGTPNIICTTFAGNALLDTYKNNPDPRFLESATRASSFLVDRLYWEVDAAEAFFSYTPTNLKPIIPVHNANLLGAAFMSRVARATGKKSLFAHSLNAARFSAAKQHGDGSWDYGESDRPSQRWIDNFHTGFNLCALRTICREAETSEFEPNIKRGFDFYRRHFFEKDNAPKYYHDRLYPIDIHSSAQSIITLVTLKDLDKDNIKLAKGVLAWTMSNMWNPQGYFYFQKHRWWTIRIPYMRWSQAWMLLALATLEESLKAEGAAIW